MTTTDARKRQAENREASIEALAVELRDRDLARQKAADPYGFGIQSADTPRTVAADVLDSVWLADVRKAAAEAAIRQHAQTVADQAGRTFLAELDVRMEEFQNAVLDTLKPVLRAEYEAVETLLVDFLARAEGIDPTDVTYDQSEVEALQAALRAATTI